MTRLIVLLGLLCLAGFVYEWWPGGLLLAGLGLLWVAAERNNNTRKAVRRR